LRVLTCSKSPISVGSITIRTQVNEQLLKGEIKGARNGLEEVAKIQRR